MKKGLFENDSRCVEKLVVFFYLPTFEVPGISGSLT